MPELTLAPPMERNPMKAILMAVLVLAAIGAAVFFLNPRKTAELTVTHVDLFSPHTEFKAMSGDGMHVIGNAQQAEDDLYVVATVHLENKLRLPLFVNGWSGSMTATDGSVGAATEVSANDLPRLEQTFPKLAPMLTHPLSNDAKANPGQTMEGAVVLLFSGSKESDWKSKKSANLTIALAHQAPQTIALP